jgi:hypothetical protein
MIPLIQKGNIMKTVTVELLKMTNTIKNFLGNGWDLTSIEFLPDEKVRMKFAPRGGW